MGTTHRYVTRTKLEGTPPASICVQTNPIAPDPPTHAELEGYLRKGHAELHGHNPQVSIDCRIVPGSFPNPVAELGVCDTAVETTAGGLTTGWWAVVWECFSSHPLVCNWR